MNDRKKPMKATIQVEEGPPRKVIVTLEDCTADEIVEVATKMYPAMPNVVAGQPPLPLPPPQPPEAQPDAG